MKSYFIDAAIEEANRSRQNHKHGAVLVKCGKVISSGHNKVTGKLPSHMYSIHAEMAAIKDSNERCGLVDTHLYVVRMNKQGLAQSKPCKLCHQYMKRHGIRRVTYSNDENSLESMYLN